MESTSNFKHFEKNMMVIPNVFLKLETVKVFFRPLYKKCRFGTCFDSQHVKVSQILAKSPWERFYHVFSSYWEKLIWKWSLVLWSQILRIFLNTSTACSIFREFVTPNSNAIIWKQKNFSQFFVPFMESLSNFMHFFKKRWSSKLMYFQSRRL